MYKYSISIKCTKMAIYHMAILCVLCGYPTVRYQFYINWGLARELRDSEGTRRQERGKMRKMQKKFARACVYEKYFVSLQPFMKVES